VVDEKSLPYLSPGVYFNSGEKTAQMRNKTREKGDMPVPQSVRQAMKLSRVKPGVGEKDFPGIFSCRVVLVDRLYISSDAPDKIHKIFLLSCLSLRVLSPHVILREPFASCVILSPSFRSF
jgi:hypothetical protein